METSRWIGLDVHAETIAVAVAECSSTHQGVLADIRLGPEFIG